MARMHGHPYDLKTARWIRENLLMQPDKDKRKVFLESLSKTFGHRYSEILRYISQDYRVMIRDDQLWTDFNSEGWVGAVWSCGRAYGKTWAGAPACIEFAMQHPNARIGLIAPTFGMGRTNMIEGSSGITKLSPRGFKPKYNRSDGTLTWPNGSTAKLFSAENGDRIRGENFSYIWVDEFCFCKFTGGDDDFWKMAKMALRAGHAPKYTITTSPRPIKPLKDLYEDSKQEGSKIIFHTGTTFDNYALPQSFIDEIKKDEGTSLYNQEVLGMILEENLGAIFTNENILRVELDSHGEDPDKYNERLLTLINSMDSIVVSVDPNVVEDIASDETGVVICGRKRDKGYVFKDGSRRGKISDIYKDVVKYYHMYNADCVVVETNNGGDFIPAAIYNIDPMVVVEKVHASRGKRSRAEPIGLLYERQKIHHVGIHRELEIQMTDYNPQVHSKSPDRMDALVWGFTKLFPSSMRGIFESGEIDNLLEPLNASKEGKLKDLYEDLYNRTTELYNPYSPNISQDPLDIILEGQGIEGGEEEVDCWSLI